MLLPFKCNDMVEKLEVNSLQKYYKFRNILFHATFYGATC